MSSTTKNAKGWSRAACLAVLGLILAGMIGARAASAELAAPTWMPGFPIAAGGQMIMMWTPVPGAAKYNVYVDGQKVGESAAFQFTGETPKGDGDHFIWVVSVGGDGKEGGASNKYKYSVIKLLPPKSVTTMAREDGIFLRWDPAPGAVIYNVYKKSPQDKEFRMIASTQDVSVKDADFKEGIEYTYTVTSKSVAGIESDRSPVATGKFAKVEAGVAGGSKGYSLVAIRSALVWEARDITRPFDVAFQKDLVVAAVPAMGNDSRVVFLDMDGKAVRSFTDNAVVPREYTGVFATSSGTVLAVDRKGGLLYELDLEGNVTTKIDVKAIKDIPDRPVPFDVVEIGGRFFVSDQRNEKILVFGRDGRFERMFGKKGRKAGEFISPTFLATDGKSLFVMDGGNNRVQTYNPEKGEFLSQFGEAGNFVGQFMRASGLAFFGDGIYAGDGVNSVVQKFDVKGVPIGALSNEKGDGALATMPTGVDVKGDLVAVAVAIGDRVQLFKMLPGPKPK